MQLIVEQEQDRYRLKRTMEKSTLRLIMDENGHVPDTMTRIRVLAGVAVVGQEAKVVRRKKGRAILEIYIKFLPDSKQNLEELIALCKEIKNLPGVQMVRILTLGGQAILHNNSPIVI